MIHVKCQFGLLPGRLLSLSGRIQTLASRNIPIGCFVWLRHIHSGRLCKRYQHFFSTAPTRLAATRPASVPLVRLENKYCHIWGEGGNLVSACACWIAER